ncbi:hypothetical protein IAT38_008055 [Cryptococcus sp. DSM 104549]
MATQDIHQEEVEDEDFVALDEDDVAEVYEDDEDAPGYDEDEEIAEGHGGEDVGQITDAARGMFIEDLTPPKENNSWGSTALHDDHRSIFALSLHPLFPNPPLAITGGQDDNGFLFCPIPPSAPSDAEASSSSSFNSESFQPVRLTGHTDSIAAAGWSFDGEMVATGGMDGRVRVWRRAKKRRGKLMSESELSSVDGWKAWEFLTNLETGSEISWLTWHPKGNVLAAGCEDATVWLWNLPSGNTLNVFSSHTLPSTAGLFPSPGKTLLTTSLDSTLILWDPRSPVPLWKSTIFLPPNFPELDPSFHGITALAVSPNGLIAAVGGAGGEVKIVSLSKGDVLTNLLGHNKGDSVEGLCFVDLTGGAGDGGKGVVCVSAGTDGRGFVWDVATGRVRSELKHDEPITTLAPHPAPNHHLLTTASADCTLKTWDIRTGTLVATHHGHQEAVNGVAVAPIEGGETAVVSAGDEGVSMVWKV